MRPLPSTILLLAVATVTAQEASKPGQLEPGQVAFADALAYAKKHKAPLLVFVLPDGDGRVDAKRAEALREAEIAAGMLRVPKGREAKPPAITTPTDLLLRQVQLLRAGAMFDVTRRGSPRTAGELNDLQRIWALAVPVVATAKACGAEPGENVVLLRADGVRQRGFAVDLLDRAAFSKSIGSELLAPEALAARHDTVNPELLGTLDRLRELWNAQQTGSTEWTLLYEKVQSATAQLAPAILGGPREKDLDTLTASLLLQHRVPFGTEEMTLLTADPCPTCGMGYLPPHLNSVLKLLGP